MPTAESTAFWMSLLFLLVLASDSTIPMSLIIHHGEIVGILITTEYWGNVITGNLPYWACTSPKLKNCLWCGKHQCIGLFNVIIENICTMLLRPTRRTVQRVSCCAFFLSRHSVAQ